MGLLLAGGACEVDLEELDAAELEPALHEVPERGGPEAGEQTARALLGITTTTRSFIGNVGAIADAVLLDVHLPLKSPTNEWQQECPYSQALESNRILRHYFAQTGERVDFFTPLHISHLTLYQAEFDLEKDNSTDTNGTEIDPAKLEVFVDTKKKNGLFKSYNLEKMEELFWQNPRGSRRFLRS